MDLEKLIIVSRGSDLALWQANWIKSQLEDLHSGLQVEIKIIKTSGDKIQDVPLAKIGGKGLFVKEIEEALLRREGEVLHVCQSYVLVHFLLLRSYRLLSVYISLQSCIYLRSSTIRECM